MDALTIVIVAICISLLFLSYRVNKLWEARTQSRPDPKTLKKLKKFSVGEPQTIKHDRPRSLTPDGKECWGAEKRDFAIFNAFWYFADSVNQLYINSEYDDLRTPIGLQELSKTRHTGPFSFDSPSYGRRYAICYKGIKIGLVEVRASLLNEQGVDVSVEIEFSPKDVPYILIWRFLRTIASLIASTEKASNYPDQTGKGYMTEFAYADTQIRDELLNLLLDMQDEDEEGVSLFTGFEIELSGTPEYYYGRAKHELERRAKQKQAAAS